MKKSILALTLLSFLAGCDVGNLEKMKEEERTAYTKLTQQLGHELPDDYLGHLRKVTGGELEPSFFWVVEGDWGSGIDEYLQLYSSEDGEALLDALNGDYPPKKKGMLPIATDGSFGYILMSFLDGEIGSIYFTCQWKEDGTELIDGWGYWKIADSFSSFQKSLEEPPEDEL